MPDLTLTAAWALAITLALALLAGVMLTKAIAQTALDAVEARHAEQP
jgi:hypothetical protein